MTGERQVHRVVAYIGLGANLDDPIACVRSARQTLDRHPEIRMLASSRMYRSLPLGPAGQPDYINAVMAVETELAPLPLLHLLQSIERQHGRVRSGERWGPRTLDLDLLLYGEQRIDTEELRVPHPGIAEREFVLVPLAEIAPDLDIPGLGPIAGLIASCPRRDSGLVAVDECSA